MSSNKLFLYNLAISYNNVGSAYAKLGEYEKALEYCLKAINIQETALLSDHPDLAISYNNVGVIYKNLGGHEKALEYFQKALTIQGETDDKFVE